MQAFRRVRIPTLAFAAFASLAIMACSTDIVRERGAYPDGSPMWERGYLRLEGDRKVAHGVHATWHPEGGSRRTLEFYGHGVRQGYAFEWNARGELVRLALCEDGLCEDRPLPASPSRAAFATATARFPNSGARVASGP